MDRPHIFVVDNEQNMLRTLAFILEAAEYSVTTAGNGREALEKIQMARDRHIPIDLLITDVRMPGLTGLELIDELRRLHIDVPVFVVTGFGDKKLVIELLRRGCEEYLDKPFDDEELIQRVTRLLAKRGSDTE